MAVIVLSGAAAAVPVVAVGWSPTAIMGAITNVLLVGGGGGIAGLLLRAMVELRRIGNERAKQEDDRDAARWTELMGLNERLQGRVERLEEDLRDERKRCDEEQAAMRRQHLDEMRAINERMEQLQRTFLAGQASTVTVLATNAASSAPKAVEAAERVGKVLRETHE